MSTGLGRIGRYELSRRLQIGKASETWAALDPQTRGHVTIRVYQTTFAADSDALREFRRSVERVASLRHPNIVPIHDVLVFSTGESDGSPSAWVCVVTDSVEGPTLADLLRHARSGGKMRPGVEMVQFFTSLGLALDYAHQQGVVHGNLNPASILLRRSGTAAGQMGEPLLTDFDYARLLRIPGGASGPFYLAPEQIRGRAATARSDTYSLGVILYELRTGVLPFRGSRPIAIMMQHLNAPPTPPEVMDPTISSALAGVILAGLAKEPELRFPSASSLAVALARALDTPLPEALRLAAPAPVVGPLSVPHSRFQAGVGVYAASTISHGSDARPGMEAAGTSPGKTLRSAPELAGRRRRLLNSWYFICVLALVFASLATIATLLFLPRAQTPAADQLVGHAYFLSSGQFNADSPQGINDELEVVLSGIPDPPAGKSYSAWLLADQNVSESLPLSLGPLHVDHGDVRLLYRGDQQHTNLLGEATRFLITLEDAGHPTSNPLIDMSTWRYYAAIPLIPSPTDKLHFSMLDHLRHLLVESPELSIRGLHGGLAFWLVRNTATVSALANNARDAWRTKDAATIRDQVIRLLDYLDGQAFARAALPPGTPLLADARASQVALLGPAPQNPDAPGYAYSGEVPPGYVYLISEHMAGAIQSPQTTTDQRRLAVQINVALDDEIRLFGQVRLDARQVLNMDRSQLLQPPALVLLNDLATQAQYAYTGQSDPSTSQTGGGALWIYENLQRLAAFEVRPYVAPK